MDRQTVVMEGEIIQDDAAQDPDLNQAFYEFIDAFDKEKTSSGVIKVYRVPLDMHGNPIARSAQKTTLFTVPIGAMTLEDICTRARDEHIEPGRHKIWIHVMAWQEGKAGVRFNRMIGVEKAIESKTLVTTNSLSAEKVLQMIRDATNESQSRTEQMMRELMMARATPAVDPLLQLKALADVVAIMGGRAGATPPVDPMQQMMTMMGMFKMMNEFMSANTKVVDTSKSEGEGLAGILSAIKEVAAPMMQGALEDKRQKTVQAQLNLARERAALAAAPAQKEPEQTTAASAGAEPKEEVKVRLIAELKDALPTLIDAASRNADVTAVAKLVMTGIPEDDVALNVSFFELLRDDDWFKQLVAINEAVVPHETWFAQLRETLLADFEPDAVR